MTTAINKRIRRKNEVLRKKITEIFGGEIVCDSENMDQGLENDLLEYVLSLESQSKKKKRITVAEKVGSPVHFMQVHEIPDDRIEQEWLKIYNYLYEKGVNLQVCSPNVDARELYRFAVEELFKMKTDDISIPGAMTCFIYDEFYPDHPYDNQQLVVDYCIKSFFCRNEIFESHFGRKVTLNNYGKLSWIEFQTLLNEYRCGFDKTKNLEIKVDSSTVEDSYGKVSGSYKAFFIGKQQSEEKCGKWTVELWLSKKIGYWLINNIQIEKILCKD